MGADRRSIVGYGGQSYPIPCDSGGFTDNPNIDAIPPQAIVVPSKNINLDENGKGKRGGTTHVNETAVSGTPEIVGAYDFTSSTGVQFQVFATNDGKIYKNTTTTIKTGLTVDRVVHFEEMNNTLYISNGVDRPQTWDGIAASTSDLTDVPTDWTGTSWPSQIVKHGRGNSERLWAIGLADNRYTIYASDNGGDDFSDANVITIIINTGDEVGLVGTVEFGDRLVVFGRKRAYIIDDTSTTTSDWGYKAAQWDGGAYGFRLIAETPNDLVAMTDDGDIYSVRTAETYGDYQSGSITKPAFINRWIRSNLKLSAMDQFHSIYYPKRRALYFFVVRQGQTQVDTALVYYVDLGPENGWIIHDNQDFASGFSASCAMIYKDSEGDFQLHTGGYAGFLWKLDQANKNDNGNGYYAGFRLAKSSLDNPRVSKMFKRGWIIAHEEGAYDLVVRKWVDGVELATSIVSLTGAGDLFDTGVFDTAVFGENALIDEPFDIGMVGRRVQLEVYNSTANEDFFLSRILIDFKLTGGRPT